jgi:hypothetical protein
VAACQAGSVARNCLRVWRRDIGVFATVLWDADETLFTRAVTACSRINVGSALAAEGHLRSQSNDAMARTAVLPETARLGAHPPNCDVHGGDPQCAVNVDSSRPVSVE